MDRSVRVLLGALVAAVYAFIFLLADLVTGSGRFTALGCGLYLAAILASAAVDAVDHVKSRSRRKR